MFLCIAALGACNTVAPVFSPPRFDQATLDGLNKIDSDAKAALAPLLGATAPGCLATSNAALFDTVTGDITSLQSHVAAISNDTRTQNGVAALGQAFQSFRSTDMAATTCLPAQQVQDQQSAIDRATTALINYENAKPKGS